MNDNTTTRYPTGLAFAITNENLEAATDKPRRGAKRTTKPEDVQAQFRLPPGVVKRMEAEALRRGIGRNLMLTMVIGAALDRLEAQDIGITL